MKMDTILQIIGVWAKLLTQLAVLLTQAVIGAVTWIAKQFSIFLEKRAEARRNAPKPAPRPPAPQAATAPRRAMSDAELVNSLVPSARELMDNSRIKAEAYAKVSAPFFEQRYEAYWRAGQRDKVPQELWSHMGKESQSRAIQVMLFKHKAQTGRDLTLP